MVDVSYKNPEYYRMKVNCTNCSFNHEVRIPYGHRLDNAYCYYCGCKSLERVLLKGGYNAVPITRDDEFDDASHNWAERTMWLHTDEIGRPVNPRITVGLKASKGSK